MFIEGDKNMPSKICDRCEFLNRFLKSECTEVVFGRREHSYEWYYDCRKCGNEMRVGSYDSSCGASELFADDEAENLAGNSTE
jgi:hypothetical protein